MTSCRGFRRFRPDESRRLLLDALDHPVQNSQIVALVRLARGPLVVVQDFDHPLGRFLPILADELPVLLFRHGDEITILFLLRLRLRRLLGFILGLFRRFLLSGRGRERGRDRWRRQGEPGRFLLCFPGPPLPGRVLLPLVDEAVVHLLPFIPVVQIQVAVELIYPAGLDHAVNHLGRLHSVREPGTGGNDISYVPPVCLQDHSVPFGVINPPGPYGEERTGGLVSGEPG